MWIHVCRGGETSNARCQLGKKARGNRERTPELNVDICSWELCGGLIAREGFLEEVGDRAEAKWKGRSQPCEDLGKGHFRPGERAKGKGPAV